MEHGSSASERRRNDLAVEESVSILFHDAQRVEHYGRRHDHYLAACRNAGDSFLYLSCRKCELASEHMSQLGKDLSAYAGAIGFNQRPGDFALGNILFGE